MTAKARQLALTPRNITLTPDWKLESEDTTSMKRRLSEVTSNISSLTRYLVNAKLDHKSGELDDETLKLAQGSIEPTLRPLIAEKTDLTSSLKTLEQVLPARVSIG